MPLPLLVQIASFDFEPRGQTVSAWTFPSSPMRALFTYKDLENQVVEGFE